MPFSPVHSVPFAQQDHRGRWCVASRRHPGRPKTSPPGGARPIVRRLLGAPVHGWTRTGGIQAIGRILHHTERLYRMRHLGAPRY
ncbi:UNVERIFIED_CONTAM: hypothetical protein FKN15_013565 [Acipenser sinensis]